MICEAFISSWTLGIQRPRFSRSMNSQVITRFFIFSQKWLSLFFFSFLLFYVMYEMDVVEIAEEAK